MEPIDDRPATKRRRRRLIVAFVLVLVLVSTVSWWYWPRGDARFVGKWQVMIGAEPYIGLVLRRNGIAEAYLIDSSLDEAAGRQVFTWESSPAYGSWTFVDGMLQVDSPLQGSLFKPALEFVDSYISLPLIAAGFTYRAVEKTSDEFVLHSSGGEMILRRIPE